MVFRCEYAVSMPCLLLSNARSGVVFPLAVSGGSCGSMSYYPRLLPPHLLIMDPYSPKIAP